MDAKSRDDRTARGTKDVTAFDIDGITEQLWRELGGKVDRQTIYQAVSDVATRYKDARIPTYLPILMRRDALKILARPR